MLAFQTNGFIQYGCAHWVPCAYFPNQWLYPIMSISWALHLIGPPFKKRSCLFSSISTSLGAQRQLSELDIHRQTCFPIPNPETPTWASSHQFDIGFNIDWTNAHPFLSFVLDDNKTTTSLKCIITSCMVVIFFSFRFIKYKKYIHVLLN